MIIGSGLLANGMSQIESSYPHMLFFASGVSNSNETDDSQFLRERLLLEKTLLENPEKTLVYFSTYSVVDASRKQNRYILHKKRMEKLVESSNKYLIFRLTNIIGSKGNKSNLIRLFINQITNGEELSIWSNVNRNIVGIDELVQVISFILKSNTTNTTLLLAHPYSFRIEEIVNSISIFLKKKPIVKLCDRGDFEDFSTAEIVKNAFDSVKGSSKEQYLKKLLEQYCQ